MTDQTSSITSTTDNRQLDQRRAIGAAFNQAAAAGVFADYRGRRSANTLKAQDSDLAVFTDFLLYATGRNLPEAEKKKIADLYARLNIDPQAWAGITWGLVQAFINWQLDGGYAISSVNRRLSTVKKYAALATKAGALDPTEKAMIKDVTGYSRKEAVQLDHKRTEADTPTRRGVKKADHVSIDNRQADRLKRCDDGTAQGRRNAVLMCLLLDHGLRAGEAAGLLVEHINFESKDFTFYRAKVGTTQTHTLSADTLAALKAYEAAGDMPPAGALLRGSRKGGKLTHAGISTRSITDIVEKLGAAIGISGLSAHDCRHYWATYWARRVEKLPKGVLTLQEAGGWSSLAMPRRYVENAKIANEGMQ